MAPLCPSARDTRASLTPTLGSQPSSSSARSEAGCGPDGEDVLHTLLPSRGCLPLKRRAGAWWCAVRARTAPLEGLRACRMRAHSLQEEEQGAAHTRTLAHRVAHSSSSSSRAALLLAPSPTALEARQPASPRECARLRITTTTTAAAMASSSSPSQPAVATTLLGARPPRSVISRWWPFPRAQGEQHNTLCSSPR